jgi:predicted permease
MPALFFAKISAADLSGGLGDYAILLYAGFFTAIACGWLFGRTIAAPQASSLLQGSARFNTFIGLAIAEAVFGTAGLQIAVLGSALLVPVVNVTVVTLMTRQLGGGGKSILRGLVKNPLILSIMAGVAFNLAGLNEVPVLHEMARILGAAALPIMLLCVGANLKLRGLSGSVRIMGLSMIGKFLINPAAVILAAWVLDPDPLAFQVALIFAALPTGVASYTLAREMKGDTSLMAAIITTQTLLSFVTLPLTLLIGQAILQLG